MGNNMENETKITEIGEVNLNNPIVIEGLPGIGFVGKIVVAQLVKICRTSIRLFPSTSYNERWWTYWTYENGILLY